ncbi:uncharacterized protein LOC112591565 [Melanaphis sacchari]|uniref:uncharacterized protein LOC112591565 n=1 Tax=Melanaphis sacchari TaxID=742174 RepID=UPI000DC133EA|nr:uncharacterized protein LOC112591565 [Melanaphis sacchari]
MTCCAPDGDEMFLMPLKKSRHLPYPGDGQPLREGRCGDTGPDKCSALRSLSLCAAEDDDYPASKPATCPETCFEDSVEWQSTKSTAAGLFRALGRHYDEPWFPTVINEWSALYYQCSHTCDYWRDRDEWLAGDEEVRLTVWSEVLKHREQHKRQLGQSHHSVFCDTDEYNPNADLMNVHDGCAVEITETHGSLNKANDRFDLQHKNVEQFCEENLPFTDESPRAEAEAAEIALADPDDNPDWVQMRRKMRGSFAALNVARYEVSAELLNHIMIELCKYWTNAPETENSSLIEQQLERNIMREIQNFRFKVFDVAVGIEPEIQQLGPDAFQEPEPCQKSESYREPEPYQKPKQYRKPEPCEKTEPYLPPEPEPCCPRKPESCRLRESEQCSPRKPELCQNPEPFLKPEPCCPKKPELCCPQGPESYCSQNPEPCCPLQPPKSKCCTPRRSTKTKLAEARARHNAIQVRDRDITTGWLGGNPHQ